MGMFPQDVKTEFEKLMGPEFMVEPPFLARLPKIERPVLISSMRDARRFVRRWMIWQGTEDLPDLLKTLAAVKEPEQVAPAVLLLKSALATHGLLPAGGGLN